ncbi:MAG: hypothetical protein EBR82_10090 [Caulobacteraceae bacterium]|nr:hypothetical protein [Caulobacteraceae bacterium]
MTDLKPTNSGELKIIAELIMTSLGFSPVKPKIVSGNGKAKLTSRDFFIQAGVEKIVEILSKAHPKSPWRPISELPDELKDGREVKYLND